MEVRIREEGPVVVAELRGRLAGSPPPGTRERLFALAGPGRRIEIDLSGITEVSGGGLRRLLLFVRHVRAMGGSIAAKGVPRDLRDAAHAAGFLELFGGPVRPAATGVPLAVPPGVDIYPTHRWAGYRLRPGQPLPLGASVVARGINFAVYSRHATSCTLVLFEPGGRAPLAEIPFPEEFRTGHVFAMIVFDLDPEAFEYGLRLDGPGAPGDGHRFDRSKVLLDPQARAVTGLEVWGEPPIAGDPAPVRARIVPQDFDWGGDRPPDLPLESLVIYEAHVRGFTASPGSGVRFPGTFAGLREKIPYLRSLGINCVELMPVFEFDETENTRVSPVTGERLCNYWGYSTVAFCAPKAGYAATGRLGMQADEFKALVKDLHAGGIEVILDVVFNHTAEGDERGPTLSFRGIDNRTYYMLAPDGSYLNFSGCGNTLNCNHPVVREFVLDSLRMWVSEYHIDGFRFDLASILGRDSAGTPLANPPLLEALAMDPVLGRTKLIAEAWDAGGLYQVGSFPGYGRFAEWNGRFRDCARRFLKGDLGQVAEMAGRLSGSPDLYAERGPTASINFVTCHDGFTLADLVSYDRKHNEANGEENRDGVDDNYSWNGGVEGPTDDPRILALRRRQAKNALVLLFLSQGVPMLLMGDEVGRSQGGNNNAYCIDSPLTWLDWTLVEGNADLLRFCRRLIAFRRRHPALRHPAHAVPGGDFDISWHGTRAGRPDFAPHSRVLAAMWRLRRAGDPDIVYAAFNMYWEPLELEIPAPPGGTRWRQFVDTGAEPPGDAAEPGAEPDFPGQQRRLVAGRSTLILTAA